MAKLSRRAMLAAGGFAALTTAAHAAGVFGDPDLPPEGAVNVTNPKSFTDPGPQNPGLAGNEPVDDLGRKNANDNRELIQTYQPPAPSTGAYFSDVGRRNVRCQPDRNTSNDAPRDKGLKAKRPTGQNRRGCKQQRRQEKNLLSAEPFAESSGTD